MKARVGKGLVAAVLMLVLLLPGVPTVAQDSAEIITAVEAATHVFYNRDSAVDYAISYAYTACHCGKYYGSWHPPQGSGDQLTTEGGDCAHFVSHCLAVGGLSNKGTTYARGWCEGGADDYIITVREMREWFDETGIATRVSSVDQLEPGDVIVTSNYGHVVLYVGTYGGKTHQVASHSAWGIFSYTYFGTPYEFWHIKTDVGKELPTVSTLSATDIGNTSATLPMAYDFGTFGSGSLAFWYRVQGAADWETFTGWESESGSGTYVKPVTDFSSGTTYEFLAGLAYYDAGWQYVWGWPSHTFTTGEDVTPPPTPTNPRPGSTSPPGPTLGSKTVTFEWDASPGATRYALRVRNRDTNQLEVGTWVYDTSYTVTLKPNTPYQWNVAAWNDAGYSPFTSLRYYQTPSDELPPEVTTHPATDETATSATLHGYLDNTGSHSVSISTREADQFDPGDNHPVPTDAVVSVETVIGDRCVEYWERVIDGVYVKNDYVLIHRCAESKEIIRYEESWREVEFTGVEPAPFAPPGGEYHWKRTVGLIDSDDCGHFYTFHDLQDYPLVCWEVRYSDGRTVMYDLGSNEIGFGIPAPSKGFSLSGYHDPEWPDPWVDYRLNADGWFQEWSFSTVSLSLPTPATISSNVSDPDYRYYYAVAHGGSHSFLADSPGSRYYSSTCAEDMSDRPPMTFAFVGHCEGMTHTHDGTFSHAFRKGSVVNTVTVGYTGMGVSPGWQYALEWQDYMFERMDEGHTMRDSFDLASAQYPLIADAVVFVGDPDLRVPAAYISFEWWTDLADKTETFAQPMSAPGPFSAGLTELTSDTTYYFRAKATVGDVTVYGEDLSFTTEELEKTGTIRVDSNLTGAPFSVEGPATYSSTTPWDQTDAPAGTYTITWGEMEGYETPDQETRILEADETIHFYGDYEPAPPAGIGFSADKNEVVVGELVTFTNLTTGGTLPYVEAVWDFGDYTPPLVREGTHDEVMADVEHAYETPGIYTVSLTMTDQLMTGTDTRHDYITVEDATATAEATREIDPPTIAPGGTVQVTVTFTAPCDDYRPGFTDSAPTGWTVSVDPEWCEPEPFDGATPEPNRAEYVWATAQHEGVDYTVVYKVQVPGEAEPGVYDFSGALGGYGGTVEQDRQPIGGDYTITVVDVAIQGQTREVNCEILPYVTVTLYDEDGVPVASTTSNEDGDYSLGVPGFGDYELVASKEGLRPETKAITVDEPTTTVDFIADYGLIPDDPDVFYVLECIILWQYPEPPCALDVFRVMDVIIAWQYPISSE